ACSGTICSCAPRDWDATASLLRFADGGEPTMRSENLIRASIALFVVVIACGSGAGLPTLGAGSGPDAKGDAGASTATGFVSSPTMADATAPQGSDRCNDTTNATE